MASKRRNNTEVIEPDLVIDVGTTAVVELSRDRVLALARSWEREADRLDAIEGNGRGTGSMLTDLIVGIAAGVADGANAQTLRECARQLRSLAGEL